MTTDVSTSIGGLRLRSPLILGSFDALVDADLLRRCFDLCGDALGAVVTKSTTLQPRAGYPEPRVARFGEGLLVASGNRNPGIERMAHEVSRLRETPSRPAILGSIVSDPDHPLDDLAEEYCLLAVAYARAGVEGLELNLSCPHLNPGDKERTIVPAQDPDVVRRLIGAVRASLSAAGYERCLVIPKLTGWNCNPVEVALAAEQAGADAVTLSNLFPGTGYYTGIQDGPEHTADQYRIGTPLLGHEKGGYSGKPMHAPVLLMIASARRYLRVPVIGTGGCASDLDSLVQTFMAGAVAVETVTPFYFASGDEIGALERMKDLLTQFKSYLQARNLQSPAGLFELRRARGRDRDGQQ